jgi:hypothetical protein
MGQQRAYVRRRSDPAHAQETIALRLAVRLVRAGHREVCGAR